MNILNFVQMYKVFLFQQRIFQKKIIITGIVYLSHFVTKLRLLRYAIQMYCNTYAPKCANKYARKSKNDLSDKHKKIGPGNRSDFLFYIF